MKKTLLALLIAFAFVSLSAQNYLIRFSGAGASTEITSILVKNLTKGTSLTMKGSDILHLSGTVGINEMRPGGINQVNIHPNPVNGFCTFDFETQINGQVIIGLYDLTGKQVMGQRDILAAGRHTYRLTGIGSGIYLLKVSSGNFSHTSKIISQNTSMLQAGLECISCIEGKGNALRVNRKTANVTYTMGYSVGDLVVATGSAPGPAGGYVVTIVVDPKTGEEVVFDFYSCYDKNGISYPTTIVEGHMWMSECLRSTKFNDGSSIPKVTDATEWSNTGLSAYCWYDNDSAKYATTYGALYNWYAVNSGKLCPSGWRVPTSGDWASLITSLGGPSIAGGKLKEIGFDHWVDPNTGATNRIGFSALPAGNRDIMGQFTGIGSNGYWWTATGVSEGSSKYLIIISSATYAFENVGNKTIGMSVRCLRN